MKPLFAYYSLEGNCRALSVLMADATGGDVAELVPAKDDMPRGAVMKYARGGWDALSKRNVELAPLAVNLRDYRPVFVGGPVWAWTMTPAVRSFLSGNDWSGMRLAVFAMCRGGAGRTAKAMADLARERGGEVVGMEVFTDLRWGDAAATRKRAAAWAAEMKRRCETEL